MIHPHRSSRPLLPLAVVAPAIVIVLTAATACGSGAGPVAGGERRASERRPAAGTVVRDPDHRIVAVRRVTLVSPGTALAVGRLTDDGRPDERFGTHGTVVTDAGAKYAAGATAVAVQRDRKILVFGWSARTAPDPQQEGKLGDLTIVRCRADGRLDPTFGTEGTSRTDLNGDFVAGALDRDGKIVVAATSFFHSSALARYRPNGRLDS